jgi:acetyltransferase-like isoleucine patch superfamily enzyme
MRKLKLLACVLILPLPWRLRRIGLVLFCGYKIAKTAAISRWSLVLPERLEMGEGSVIGAFTVCKGMSLLRLEEKARIGAFNWITGFPIGTSSKHFSLDMLRKPQLIVERHAAITNRHLIDCTDEVRIGAYATFAGFRSQILTHSIDLKQSRQRCKPVRIGQYCFVGTGCILLGGSSLPDRSILAAHSLLASAHEATDYLYGGVPAKPIKTIDQEDKYFSRTTGYVL